MTETFDGIDWEISEFPVGSCTPDEFYELTYHATGKCPDCGSEIEGRAQYWSRDSEMTSNWLDRVDYEPCECENEDEEVEDDDDDDSI